MTKALLLSISLLAAFSTIGIHCSAIESPNLQTFISWKKTFGKKYESDLVMKQKFQTFIENNKQVNLLNKLHKGETEFKLNKFADLSAEEFRTQILMRSEMKPKKAVLSEKLLPPTENVRDLPESFDWREKGAVTPVKDQGSVGSCWAFSAVSYTVPGLRPFNHQLSFSIDIFIKKVQNLEGQFFLKGNKLTNLSVEQVVDCNGFQDPNSEEACCGVFGGWPQLVFEYVKETGGIESEDDYSYCSGLNEACYPCGPPGYNETRCGPNIPYCYLKDSCQAKLDPSKFVKNLDVVDWKKTSENETDIAAQLMSIGPLSVALDATMLQFYHKGIFNPILGCSKTHLNHAVLLVGWGSEGGKPYWLVKNSWGVKWGEEGYFKILRDKGLCGINTQVTSAVLN